MSRKVRISIEILLFSVLITLAGATTYRTSQTVQQSQQTVAEIQQLRDAVEKLAPQRSDGCFIAQAMFAYDGLMFNMGDAVICASDEGLVFSNVIWPTGINPAAELRLAYEQREYWRACAMKEGPCT